MNPIRRVLILCTGNSCRSQMAEGLVNALLKDSWSAYSAGIDPKVVNPRAIRVMAEIGIDISKHRSKPVSEFLSRRDLDLIITVCDHARESCPVFPGRSPRVHLGFEDPSLYSNLSDEEALPRFRKIRDELKSQLIPFLQNYDRNKSSD